MSVRITSDGTVAGTHVVDAKTGEEITELRRVKISFDVNDGITAHLTSAHGTLTTGVESVRLDRDLDHDAVVQALCEAEEEDEFCPECGGTGEVQLFTSTRPCSKCGGK